jgi:hypothetical protein
MMTFRSPWYGYMVTPNQLHARGDLRYVSA